MKNKNKTHAGNPLSFHPRKFWCEKKFSQIVSFLQEKKKAIIIRCVRYSDSKDMCSRHLVKPTRLFSLILDKTKFCFKNKNKENDFRFDCPLSECFFGDFGKKKRYHPIVIELRSCLVLAIDWPLNSVLFFVKKRGLKKKKK